MLRPLHLRQLRERRKRSIKSSFVSVEVSFVQSGNYCIMGFVSVRYNNFAISLCVCVCFINL